jgi:hypothetical protein
LSSKGLHIHSQKYKHLRDQRLGPFEVLEKVGLKSYKLKLPPSCRLHPVFHCDLLSKASNPTPLRHEPDEIESDHNEYAIDYISDVKIDSWPNRRGPYLQFLTHILDMMFLSGCYLNKWMIVNNYMCSSHQMFGHNFLKHDLTCNSNRDILLEMLT